MDWRSGFVIASMVWGGLAAIIGWFWLWWTFGGELGLSVAALIFAFALSVLVFADPDPGHYDGL